MAAAGDDELMALLRGQYDADEVAIAGEFLTMWLPFLSTGLCPSYVASLRGRVTCPPCPTVSSGSITYTGTLPRRGSPPPVWACWTWQCSNSGGTRAGASIGAGGSLAGACGTATQKGGTSSVLWRSLEEGSSGERNDVEDRSVSAIDLMYARLEREKTKMLGENWRKKARMRKSGTSMATGSGDESALRRR